MYYDPKKYNFAAFGTELEKRRKFRGYGTIEFAIILGMDEIQLQEIEAGEVNPPLNVVLKAKELLELGLCNFAESEDIQSENMSLRTSSGEFANQETTQTNIIHLDDYRRPDIDV